MRKLIIYPNCSKGGVASVIRGRARSEPSVKFDAIFLNDRGGRSAYDDLPNVSVRVVHKSRLQPFLRFITKEFEYESIHVLSLPDAANFLSADSNLPVIYEFHSSDMKVVESEISDLHCELIGAIHVPSNEMSHWVGDRLSRRDRLKVRVVPNLVDRETFSPESVGTFFGNGAEGLGEGKIPLVWVGRFDKGKGYQYFTRLLAKLPENYVGIVVCSLENDPARFSAFLSEADALGVRHRVWVYMDLAHRDVGNLYASVRDLGGWYVSTSLMESFGYSIEEAIACGLPVAAFELPVLRGREGSSNLYTSPIGEVQGLAEIISQSGSRVNGS